MNTDAPSQQRGVCRSGRHAHVGPTWFRNRTSEAQETRWKAHPGPNILTFGDRKAGMLRPHKRRSIETSTCRAERLKPAFAGRMLVA